MLTRVQGIVVELNRKAKKHEVVKLKAMVVTENGEGDARKYK
jgi:hypothetical protein